MLYWGYLTAAIFFEVLGTLSLKYSSINTNHLFSGLVVVFYVLSFTLMWYAIKKIDISVAYAIWAGMGTALITIIGAKVFDETLTPMKILFVAFIIIGVVGLKYVSEQ